MSEEVKDEQEKKDDKPKKQPAQKKETKYDLEEVLANSKVFNAPKYVLYGALNKKGDSFTKKEVEGHLKQFLKTEVN